MIYGLYLSATGIVANSYRQDVLSNNLANAETIGFKRDIPVFQQRLTEAQSRRQGFGATNLDYEPLGGGLLVAPTVVDHSHGELEPTGNSSDVAIQGDGYLMVNHGGRNMLTRDGRLMVNRQGRLVMASSGDEVLNKDRQPIQLDATHPIVIAEDGTISQQGEAVARLGVFQPADANRLVKRGGNLMADPQVDDAVAQTPTLRSGFLERSNADAISELTQLMEAQRQLEANANMIRYQDQTLARLVNDVPKIG